MLCAVPMSAYSFGAIYLLVLLEAAIPSVREPKTLWWQCQSGAYAAYAVKITVLPECRVASAHLAAPVIRFSVDTI